jgi:hypothetical protein
MKRRRSLLWSAGLAASAVLVACATQWEVESFAAPEVDVAAKRTFVWQPGELGIGTPVSRSVATSTEAGIRQAVSGELQRKGYAEVTDAAAADLRVTYQVAGIRRFVLAEDPRVGAPSPNEVLTPSEVPPPPASELPREQTIREGTVLVFVEEAKSGRLAWRGLVNAEERVTSAEAGQRMVIDMARHIAQEFPARKAAP